jgi:hypothetical protein
VDGYNELEKLIKLTDHDKEIRTKALEKLGQSENNETASD